MTRPDLAQAARFLELLDPDADEFTFQTFADRPGSPPPRVVHGALDRLGAGLARANRDGSGIFVTINKTDGRGRKAENIVAVRATFVDLDGSPLEPVRTCELEPHVVVQTSPGRWHCYWLCDLPLDQFTTVQKAIITRFGGDKAVHDTSRVMRLPGFWHMKGEPALARIIAVNEGLPYHAERILEVFGPAAPEGDDADTFTRQDQDRGRKAAPPEDWRRIASGPVREGERNRAAARLTGHLLRRWIDPYVTRALVGHWNEAACDPPLPADELERTVASVATKELARRKRKDADG